MTMMMNLMTKNPMSMSHLRNNGADESENVDDEIVTVDGANVNNGLLNVWIESANVFENDDDHGSGYCRTGIVHID